MEKARSLLRAARNNKDYLNLYKMNKAILRVNYKQQVKQKSGVLTEDTIKEVGKNQKNMVKEFLTMQMEVTMMENG